MAFFVELPADEYGNRAYSPCVLEAEIIQKHRRDTLLVKAPPEFRKKWPTLLLHQYGGWIQCEGPARLLSREEQRALVAELVGANA